MRQFYRSRGASPLQLMIALAIGLSLIASGFHYYSAMLARIHQDQKQIELVDQFDMAGILLRDAFERVDHDDLSKIITGENISAFEVNLLRYPIHWYRFEGRSSDRLSDQSQDQSLQDGNRNTGGLRLARADYEKSEYYTGGVRYVARESDLLIVTEKIPLGYWKPSNEISLAEVLRSAIERSQIVSGKYPPLLWATNGEAGVLFKAEANNRQTSLPIASADLRQIKALSATALKGSDTPIFIYQLQSKQFYTLKERGEYRLVIDGFDGQAFIRILNMIRFRLAVFNKNAQRWEYNWDLDETDSALISVELIGGVGAWESSGVEFLYRESTEVEMKTGINHHPEWVDARRLLFYLGEL